MRWTDVTVHVRTDGVPGSALLPALAAAELGHLGYAWICGESGMVTEARRHLVRSAGVDRRTVLFSGFWKAGPRAGVTSWLDRLAP